MLTSFGDSSSDLQPTQDGSPAYACNCSMCAGSGGNNLQNPSVQPDVPATGAGGVAALLAGSQWAGQDVSGKTVVTYSFSNASSQFSDESNRFSATLTPFSEADKAMTWATLESISAVCNLRFVEVPDQADGSGQLRYAYSKAPNEMGFSGFAFFPSNSAAAGDVWIGADQASSKWDFFRPNLVLHETLHALGLKHPFEGPVTLDTQSNILANTVMSYSAVAGITNLGLFQYPTEPMPLDVAALQALYGAAAHNEGDTVYRLDEAQFQGGFRALWDSSGRDTLDAGAVSQGVALDLGAGERSDIGASVGTYSAQGVGSVTYTWTLAIALGCKIENAIGSRFDDVILGNELDNLLIGGEGNDMIHGGGGSNIAQGGEGDDRFVVAGSFDQINGGPGMDTVTFLGSREDFVFTEGLGQMSVARAADRSVVASLVDVERVEFSDAVLAVLQPNLPLSQLQGHGGEALRLYKAALDRLPDIEGLSYHTKALDNGASLADVAQQFMSSPEFQARYGQPTNSQFVELLYANVLDRSADTAGLSFHLARLGSGASRADILVGFSESPENQASVVGLGQIPVLYEL